MTKRVLFTLLVASFIGRVCAQDGFVPQTGTLTYDVFDRNGKAFVNPAPDVAGSPFFRDDWRLGSLVVNTNRRFDSVRLRLNLLSQEVHFLDRNNNEMALTKGYIKEMLLPADPTGRFLLRFRNGFPPVDQQDQYSFYQVLAEGKLSLILSRRKIIASQKDAMLEEVKKEYRTYEDYYIYDGKIMDRVRKDKAIIAGKELKFKSIDVLKKAIEDYNAS
jgi:hypothetical protein